MIPSADATSKNVYGPYAMQGAVIDTAKIAPAFQCDGQAGQCGKSATEAEVDRELRSSGRASDLARAEALAPYSGVDAPPKPWFLTEDYTDRHGSFLNHNKQWCGSLSVSLSLSVWLLRATTVNTAIVTQSSLRMSPTGKSHWLLRLPRYDAWSPHPWVRCGAGTT